MFRLIRKTSPKKLRPLNISRLSVLILLIIIFGETGSCFLIKSSYAKDQSFDDWIEDLRTEAITSGISEKTFNNSMKKLDHPIDRIIELDRKQPEGTMSFAQYKKQVITPDRIKQGRALYKKHHDDLMLASQRFGVKPQYIVALWGIETSYGKNTGGFSVIHVLATLAYDGRRSEFFRSELITALGILEAGHITNDKMRGSWAGAMGQNQFMPSSFNKFAIDGNGDRKRDIWTSLPDVFSSTANYLNQSGWHDGERWGRRVMLPEKFDKEDSGLDTIRSLDEWQKMGVRQENGAPLPSDENMKASIVIPGDDISNAFIVYDNYRVIMKWNKSTYFATCVGLLADEIVQ